MKKREKIKIRPKYKHRVPHRPTKIIEKKPRYKNKRQEEIELLEEWEEYKSGLEK